MVFCTTGACSSPATPAVGADRELAGHTGALTQVARRRPGAALLAAAAAQACLRRALALAERLGASGGEAKAGIAVARRCSVGGAARTVRAEAEVAAGRRGKRGGRAHVLKHGGKLEGHGTAHATRSERRGGTREGGAVESPDASWLAGRGGGRATGGA